MRKIAHIINPVIVKESSDLFIAQPITFETMRIAQEFARGHVDVALYSAQYPEDRPIIPEWFQMTPDLDRSILNIGSFHAKRKLPLVKDYYSSECSFQRVRQSKLLARPWHLYRLIVALKTKIELCSVAVACLFPSLFEATSKDL